MGPFEVVILRDALHNIGYVLYCSPLSLQRRMPNLIPASRDMRKQRSRGYEPTHFLTGMSLALSKTHRVQAIRCYAQYGCCQRRAASLHSLARMFAAVYGANLSTFAKSCRLLSILRPSLDLEAVRRPQFHSASRLLDAALLPPHLHQQRRLASS